MSTEVATKHFDEVRDSGFVAGLLTARYYTLRYGGGDSLFQAPAPKEMPAIVKDLLLAMCRGSIDHRLFETSWASLDHLLLCDSSRELACALAMIPDRHFQ